MLCLIVLKAFQKMFNFSFKIIYFACLFQLTDFLVLEGLKLAK